MAPDHPDWEANGHANGRTHTRRHRSHRMRIWCQGRGKGFDWEIRRRDMTWVAGGHERTLKSAKVVAVAVVEARSPA